MTDDRRIHERYRIWFPMRLGVDGNRGLAISYDASAKGLLIAAPAALAVGDKVEVTFQIPSSGDERTIEGTVVRVGVNEADPDGMWPNKLAVEFDEEVPGLASVLRARAEKAD